MFAQFQKYTLHFKSPGGTSRGILKTKNTWFLTIHEGEKVGLGECAMFPGLSYDDVPNYEAKLAWTCNNIQLGLPTLLQELQEFPSIQFGLEQAFLSLNSSNKFELLPSKFTNSEAGIPINGLIWMGDKRFMNAQIKEKIAAGFTCIKMKIGAIDFKTELELLQSIRKEFSESQIQLRVDANGAFAPNEALEKLKYLSKLKLHSIEQPIKPGQPEEMARLCEETPLPIALDEELIGIIGINNKKNLLQTIKPQYIILKPSLIGGFAGTEQWISLANQLNVGWWITSALESNVGLNAIAQYTFTLNTNKYQGLGTGSLFTNNFTSPLQVKNAKLHYLKNKNWIFNL